MSYIQWKLKNEAFLPYYASFVVPMAVMFEIKKEILQPTYKFYHEFLFI